MSTTTKPEHGHDKAPHARKDDGRGASVAITFSVPWHLDDVAVTKLRHELERHVEKFLEHRLGGKPIDLICH